MFLRYCYKCYFFKFQIPVILCSYKGMNLVFVYYPCILHLCYTHFPFWGANFGGYSTLKIIANRDSFFFFPKIVPFISFCLITLARFSVLCCIGVVGEDILLSSQSLEGRDIVSHN